MHNFWYNVHHYMDVNIKSSIMFCGNSCHVTDVLILFWFTMISFCTCSSTLWLFLIRTLHFLEILYVFSLWINCPYQFFPGMLIVIIIENCFTWWWSLLTLFSWLFPSYLTQYHLEVETYTGKHCVQTFHKSKLTPLYSV